MGGEMVRASEKEESKLNLFVYPHFFSFLFCSYYKLSMVSLGE